MLAAVYARQYAQRRARIARYAAAVSMPPARLWRAARLQICCSQQALCAALIYSGVMRSAGALLSYATSSSHTYAQMFYATMFSACHAICLFLRRCRLLFCSLLPAAAFAVISFVIATPDCQPSIFLMLRLTISRY